MKNVFTLLLCTILFSSSVYAAGITAAATFQIDNSLPVIKLGAYQDPNLAYIKDTFRNNEEGYLRIDINDLNGYSDIQSVKVKMVGIKNNTAMDIPGYEDFINASYVNGQGGSAAYMHKFSTLSGYDDYRFYVKVNDGEDETIESLDINIDNNIQATGAAVSETSNRNAIFSFFRNLLNKLFGS